MLVIAIFSLITVMNFNTCFNKNVIKILEHSADVVCVAMAQVLLRIEIVVQFVSEVMEFFRSEKGGRKLVRDG